MAEVQKISLNAAIREVFGKKLKKLRKAGVVPGNIFGTAYKSQAVSVDLKDFNRTFKVAGETGIVYLKLDKQEIPTLISNVHTHPVKDLTLHVDFRKVDLTKTVETQVPIKVVGESVAVEQKGGVLLTQLHEVTVEALPQDIPHSIEVDISKIQEVGEEIKVSDLPKSDKFKIMEEPEKVVVSVIEHKEESLEPETAKEEPEIIEEKPEGEVAEGEEAATAAALAEEGAKPQEKEAQQKAEQKGEQSKEAQPKQKPNEEKKPKKGE